MQLNEDYESLKVGQLRLLCKQRSLSGEGKKEDLIFRLVESDNAMKLDSLETHQTVQQQTMFAASMPADNATTSAPNTEPALSPEEMKEIATIADEIRHIRRQWVRFFSSSFFCSVRSAFLRCLKLYAPCVPNIFSILLHF